MATQQTSQAAYAELHCISNFSFLRGASSPEELVTRSAALGYTALAITDECSLAGLVRAHVAARDTGMHIIAGSEFHLDDSLHLVLLATDRNAYAGLCTLITIARRRAPKGLYRLALEDLQEHARGCLLIWVNAHCCQRPVQYRVARWLGRHFHLRCWLGVYRALDGTDHLQLHILRLLAKRFDLPLVACGQVRMHVRERKPLLDTLTAIRLGKPLSECGHELCANAEHALRSMTALARLYPPELLAESRHIAARCSFSLDELRYEYPRELAPGNIPLTRYLHRLTLAGMHRRWPEGAPAKVRELVRHELQLVSELRYEPYFLTVHDIVRFARSRNILCQGRGSAANSAICYCLGITEVDPARINTLFERFISRQRNEPPDIDVDFEHQRREEVFRYIYDKYGRHRAALTATVITYRVKSALRDVGKALGFDPGQIERLVATAHRWSGKTLSGENLRQAGLSPGNPRARRLLQLASELIGFPRHLSQHVGGFVITRDTLHHLVPIENAAMAHRTVIQWDKDDLDALGLLKIDCLSLGMLSAIRRCLDLVRTHHGRSLQIDRIPAEDPAVYRMISRADTVGVFQIESRAQMSMLPRLRPACFYDLVIEVAIVRPGPIQGDMVHPYLRRRQGLEPVHYPSDEVRSVLQRTLGVPIFQEQVIQLAVVAAGFSPGEADQLRRSMAAWRRNGELQSFEQRLIEGMLRRGYPRTFAQQVFQQILGFGEYGFPESHSASFALLVYVSAWLKHYYPEAFTCALLNSQPMGFYSPRQLVNDLRRHGGRVLPVDINCSAWESSLESVGRGMALRLGMHRVSRLSRHGAQRILRARRSGAFVTVEDLAARAQLDRGDMQALAAADVLRSLAGNRHLARWACAAVEPGTPLFGSQAIAEPAPPLPVPGEGEELVCDYASLGLSLGRHPLALLRPQLGRLNTMTSRQLLGCPHGRPARMAGIVTGRQSPGNASGVVFLTLEDETGVTQVIVWPKLAGRQRRVLLASSLLLVEGQLQREGEVLHLVAKRLEDHSRLLGRLSIPSRDFH